MRLAVFLHAFPLAADMWRPQLQELPGGWSAVAPDAFNPAMLDWLRAVDGAAAGQTNPESRIPNPESRTPSPGH